MCGFQGTQKPYTISGDNGERDPPVPIPNTEVKPFSADGTWLETTWESRTLPDSTKKKPQTNVWGFFFVESGEILLPAHHRRSQRTYLVRFRHVRRLWRIQHGGYAWESRRQGAKETLCIRYAFFPGRFQANVQHCTWLGF